MAKMEFSAIVPVAGAGMRLRPHTHTYPKVLLTVGDKPIIGHILDELSEAGIKKIYMVIGYLGGKIKTYVSEKYPRLDVEYITQDEPKGLGHAIWITRRYVKGPALVMLGDTIISADLRLFLGAGEDAIGVREVADPRRFGVVKIEKGRITNMVEKPKNPPSNMAIVGLYAFKDSGLLYKSLDRLVTSGKTTGGEIQLTDALALMLHGGHKFKPVTIEGWYDCGKPETLLETNRYILNKKKHVSRAGNCTILEPVYISPRAKVSGSVIGPYASIGDGATVESSIISDSIINENAVIVNMNLSRSLVGPSATIIGRREQINIGENSEIRFDKAVCEL
ncbi:MAG: NTP transferase domain-containing protein [Elusimicrobia bacterium]|nr:NTP transferase domain-containing protein [Elusimicrobiota bacterium]